MLFMLGLVVISPRFHIRCNLEAGASNCKFRNEASQDDLIEGGPFLPGDPLSVGRDEAAATY